jgi:hypothetical protein
VNDSLFAAVTALLPGSDTFLSEINLLPLSQLIQQVQQFDVGLFQAELKIAGSLMNSKMKEDIIDLQQSVIYIAIGRSIPNNLPSLRVSTDHRGINCHM